MKEWYSASELAGLPGMPGTERGIRKAARRGDWQSRARKARGGGREYHLSALPHGVRAHLQREAAITLTATLIESEQLQAIEAAAQSVDEARLKAKEKGLAAFAALPPGPKKTRIKARRELLLFLTHFRREHQGSKTATRLAFAEAINDSRLPLPAWVLEQLPRRHGRYALSHRTLERWELNYAHEGVMGLADGYGNRKGQSKIEINEALMKVVLGCILNFPHITSKKIKQFLEAEHPELNIVSEGAIRRFVSHWQRDNAQLWTYITNPDKWKNIYMVAFGSHFDNITHLNQLWEMDSTPADWMLKDGRHSVVGAIDLFSRRLKFRVSKTSKAEAVCLTFRDAVLAWGVPDGVRTDNGQDYVSEHFDGVLNELEIIHELCLPFASEQKGTIERSMRTMSHGILDLLPGFIGHSVADRKVIEARKSFADRIMNKDEVVEVSLTAAELQEKLDQWTEHVYGKDVHSGLDGKTPAEMATGQRVRRIDDIHALDMLLLPIEGVRTVSKKGIRLEHHHYTAPELVAYIQQDVRLRRDPEDLGRLFVYGVEGEFICEAICDLLLGLSPAEKAAVAKASQKSLMAEHKAELSDTRRAINKNPAQAIIEHRIAQSHNVTTLPAPSDTYTTPALQAAGQAARCGDAPAPPTDEQQAEQAAFVAEFERGQVQDMPETDGQRYARWRRLQQRAESGGQMSEAERQFFDSFATSHVCKTYQMLEEDFGEALWKNA